MTETETIQLGDIACDPITGFEGMVVCKTTWLYDGERVTLQPQALKKDGAPQETQTFATRQVVLVTKAAQ